MLPKLHCLTGQENFKKVATGGRSFFLKELGLKWRENNLTNSRFAFVVSTQIDKRSTVRNKIKRRLRDIVYQRLEKIKPGFDLMFLTRPAIKNLEYADLAKLAEQLLIKAGLI